MHDAKAPQVHVKIFADYIPLSRRYSSCKANIPFQKLAPTPFG